MITSNITLIDIIRQKASTYLDGNERCEIVLEKMIEVDRALFLPIEVRKYACFDVPIAIGYNQTCSQPSMVAFMLDQLSIQSGNKILEIGSGCGYAAAIASKLCANTGSIWAVEIIPQLANMMEKNIDNNYQNIKNINRDGSKGLQEEMPFDRIFLSAGVHSNAYNREILLKQLTENGILIYPETHGSLFKIIKHSISNEIYEYSGVSFVPLTGDNF